MRVRRFRAGAHGAMVFSEQGEYLLVSDVVDVLTQCSEFLDDYVDVNDGDDGHPRPNRAMSLQCAVLDLLGEHTVVEMRLRGDTGERP